jgi:3-phosphoshikimate 1-carboxyvinyltransferase
MIATIQPGGLNGTILAPASKSSMQRACAAALLRAGKTVIHHPGHSNDDKAALSVVQALGAKVETLADGSLQVESSGVIQGVEEVNCGESGLGLRMFAPIIALSPETIRVKGEGSLLKRPMDFFDEIFPQLGIRVVSNGGRLPLEIQGPLQPQNIEIDGTITVRDLKSKPYIDLTLQVMQHFGWVIENRNYEAFSFSAERKAGSPEYTVEGDWSGGAFLLVAGAIAGPILVKGLDSSSTQADKAILAAVCDAGAVFEDREEGFVVGPTKLKAFTFDATDCPDLFPPLVALAAYCEGTTEILGVSRLAHKESNRGLTLQEEFGKMGVRVELDGDLMKVYGSEVKGATVHSRHDHRIAMACAVAALKASGPVTIGEADAINKSYPDFYRHLQQLGGIIS